MTTPHNSSSSSNAFSTGRPEETQPGYRCGDYSVARLIESLQVLSRAADPDLKLARQGTDKDDEMTEKDVVKKKKRWWDPFD